ncbi:MAG: hypothetical protein ABIQ16_10930 [Polyangiaceae bacterium]
MTGLAAARSCGDKAESAVEEGRDALAQLGPKDAEIFRAAQQAAGGPGAFMRDLGALGKAVGDAIPNGKVNLIGDIGGSPVYGSTVTRIGIATVDGVTQIVRAPLDSSPEILGPFHP